MSMAHRVWFNRLWLDQAMADLREVKERREAIEAELGDRVVATYDRGGQSSIDALRRETELMRAVVGAYAGQGVLDAMKLDGDSGRGNVVGFRREGDRLVLVVGSGEAALGSATLRSLAGVLHAAADAIDAEKSGDR